MRLNYTSLNRSPTSLSYLLSSGFKPASLFAQSEPGVWLDPSDVADLAWRRNLLTYSEQFNNAAWVKTRTTVTPNAVIAPDGTLTADTLTASANDPYIQQDIVANSRTYTWSVYLKGAGSSIGRRPLLRITRDAYTEVLNSSGLPLLTANWQRYVFSATFVSAPVASVGARVDFVEDNDIGFTVDFWGAQIELGSTATPYQRISDVTTEVLERFPTTTLFQDTAGTTPVTTPGQPVGLVLDKSKNGVGTNGSARRNIYTFTEQFENAAWGKNDTTIAADVAVAPNGTTTADKLQETAVTAPYFAINRNPSGTVSTAYTWSCYAKAAERSFLLVNFSVAGVVAGINLTTGATQINSGTATLQAVNVGNGWWRFSVAFSTAASGANPLYHIIGPEASFGVPITAGTAGFGFFLWGAQLELGRTPTPYQRITADWTSTIPGNHATQATAASRPTYGVHPSVGLRNLAHGSADVGNATYWPTTLLNNGITATKIDSGFDTDGLPYVDVRYQGTSTATFHSSIYSTLLSRTTAAAGQTFTASASLQRIGGSLTNLGPLTLILVEETAPSTFVNQSASPGTVETYPVMDTVSRTLVSGNQVRVGFVLNFSSGVTIDATFRVKGLQLELGSSRTAYQFNYNRFNVTEAGVASVSYLSFDGVNSSLVTPTITPGTDKVQVFAGVRKLSTNVGIIAELSTITDNNNGTFMLLGNWASTRGGFRSKGTIPVDSLSGTAAVESFVITGLGDIGGDRSTLRFNGTQALQSTGDQGTGNYLAYPIYIGARGGGGIATNGNIYSLIVRFGTNLAADQIASIESSVGSKTGFFAPTITGVPTIGVS